MSESEEIVIKFNKFIDILRVESEQLSEEEKKHISNLDDFFSPCQLLIIIFRNFTTKYLIVTHDETRTDREIELHQIDTWDAVGELEKISNYPWWNKEFPDEEKRSFWGINNYQELIESQLIGIIQRMENSLYIKPPESFIGGKSMLHKRDFTWTMYDETYFEPEKEAMKIVHGAKNQYKYEKNKPKPPVSKDTVKPKTESPEKYAGFGSYIYLPIWLNEYPELSFREKIRGTRASFYFDKKFMTASYKGSTVVIEENGYIGICEKERHTANRYLNEIMGTGFLFGLPFFAIRDGDMSGFGFQKDTTRIGSRQIIPRGNILRQFDRGKRYWEPDFHPHISIREEGFSHLLKMAEIISNESEVSNCILLFVEANTCLQSSQYMQSFIVSWTIIEKYLYWVWGKHLKNKKVNRKRRDRLTGSNWNIARVIEILDVNGLITRDDYKLITELRQKRNDLIHEGDEIHKDEALKCFEYASSSLIHRTNAFELFSKDALTKHIIQKYDPHDFRY